jgi:hypothetical protein
MVISGATTSGILPVTVESTGGFGGVGPFVLDPEQPDSIIAINITINIPVKKLLPGLFMNKEKSVVNFLILLYLLKSTDRSNLSVAKRLQNLIVCCVCPNAFPGKD